MPGSDIAAYVLGSSELGEGKACSLRFPPSFFRRPLKDHVNGLPPVCLSEDTRGMCKRVRS